MGKVGLLGLVVAAVTVLDNRGILSKWGLNIFAYAIFLFFCTVLFALDLKRFFENPYPLRTKVVDILLSTFLGDYADEHRCWFNWKLNLYGNQFFAKEVLFDKFEYPALYSYKDVENDLSDENRNFHPRVKFRLKRQRSWCISRTTGLEDEWENTNVDLQGVTSEDTNKVCFRFFSVGNCQIKLKVQIEEISLFKCIAEVYRVGAAEKFAEHMEHFTDSLKVELLFAYFDECQGSPLSGVVDVRKGGVRKNAKIVYCFRIQDAMKFINDNRCALISCQHVDHGFWIL